MIDLNRTIQLAKKTELYRDKLKDFNEIKDIRDIARLPFTTKENLRCAYPFGGLAVDISNVIEMHTSSGTTGLPTLSFYTKEDLGSGSCAISRAWKNFGIDKNSRVQFIMSYGLFSGAMINTYAIQELGAFVLPASILPVERQIELMIDFGIDTVVATPGYLMYISECLKRFDKSKLKLKRAIAAGEIYSNILREEIEKRLSIIVYDHYGLCEVNTGIAYECKARSGLHILDDYVIAEIIDNKTGQRLPNGEYGELVLTSLKKEASPIIRYRTGDITCIKDKPCSCGNSSIRIDRIKARVDDLIFIKGIKINPHELKEIVLGVAGEMIFGSDIKILIKNNVINYKPCIQLSIKKEFINRKKIIGDKIKDIVGINFDIQNVDYEIFGRNNTTKNKLVEFM